MKRIMSPRLFLQKLLILILGLFVLAFGISICSATDLGVSPSQSVSYIMSVVFQQKPGISFLSWGVCTTILNLLFFIGQILILRKDFKPIYCLQMVVVFAFSYFTDLTKAIVNLMPITEQAYWIRLLIQIAACAVIGLGIYLQLKADLIVMATEGFVNALAKVIRKDFGLTKIFVDWGCVALTVIISFLALGHLDGVREGTVINAFLNGYFVRVFTKHVKFLDNFVGARQDVLPEVAYGTVAYPLVITIDREMGSGGGLIAEALSKALGIKLYDYELIEKTAKEAGLPAEDVMKRDERPGSYILKNRPNTMKLFFSADPESRAKVVSEKIHISYPDALKVVKHEDAQRINYCRHFTGTDWGIAAHYGMTLHTSDYGLDNSVKLVLEAMNHATCMLSHDESS